MKILEVKITYQDSKINSIVVLADFTSSVSSKNADIRAISASTKQMGGYFTIIPTHQINDELLQNVVDYGMEIDKVDDIFPNWRNRYPIG